MAVEVIAWGVGLIALGTVVAFLGLRFLRNSRGVADDYYWSMAATRRGRRLVEVEPGIIRGMLGVPLVILGALFGALGIYGLVRGFISN